MVVQLTQFIRPNGRQRFTYADVDESLRPIVESILKQKLRFTAEDLENGSVALTIESDEEDLDIEIATNGPGENNPVASLEKLIRRFGGRNESAV